MIPDEKKVELINQRINYYEIKEYELELDLLESDGSPTVEKQIRSEIAKVRKKVERLRINRPHSNAPGANI